MKRLLLALLLLCTAPMSADVLRVVIDDTIHPISEEVIGRALAAGAAQNAQAVIIELRTPGGLETSTRKIVESILRSRVPVVVHIAPGGSRAASAGFFILQAADVAAMAPGTNTGAAHPVLLGGAKLDDVMKMKMQNDSAAFMRSVVQRRGRNVAAAESAVREAKSFTETEALNQKLIELVAADTRALLRALDGRTIRRFDGTTTQLRVASAHVREHEITLRQKVLSWLMDPNVAFVLFSLGMLALWAEFKAPGAILPGVVGLLSIVLAVFALNLLPTRFIAVVMILLAFALFAAEAKFTSHGLLGIGGVISLTFGAVMLVDGPIPELRVSIYTALAVSLPLGAIAIFLMTLVARSYQSRVTTGIEGMIGEVGVARTRIDGHGKVFVHGETWNATSATPIEAGTRVRINAVNGLRVDVSPEQA